MLCAGGGIVALIVIITVATTWERRRKQRASAYGEPDDYPYYNEYGEPPYDGNGTPPYDPEDANAPYDDGNPAPWETDAWEEDGASYPADGTRYGAEEIESELLNPESVERSYDNSGAAFDAPDIPYGTDAPPLEDDYPATDEESESGRGDASGL